VLLVASQTEYPRAVLFADEAGSPVDEELAEDAFGFYWTEGRGGLGWAQDAVPTLKGGSTIGIPSPPAIWAPMAGLGRQFVTPSIEDAEDLQGVPRGWTDVAVDRPLRNGPRWKLVGNAVTVDVAAWLATRLIDPGLYVDDSSEWEGTRAWPTAAWGEAGKVRKVEVSEYPVRAPYRHLADVVDTTTAKALSHRAITGFQRRLHQGNLGRYPGFRDAVAQHVDATGHRVTQLAV
jgi:DNA (cytosine-5)-methyltransferase 1